MFSLLADGDCCSRCCSFRKIPNLGLSEVWNLALNDPDAYSFHMINHYDEVAIFGGIFLLLVFLNFLLDEKKKLHWLGRFEEKVGSFGRFASIPVLVALGVLMLSLSLAEERKHLVILTAGLWGILTYLGCGPDQKIALEKRNSSDHRRNSKT